MTDKETPGTSEAQIAVHWHEEATYRPGTRFIARANMTDR